MFQACQIHHHEVDMKSREWSEGEEEDEAGESEEDPNDGFELDFCVVLSGRNVERDHDDQLYASNQVKL